jgi:hypothetical protein
MDPCRLADAGSVLQTSRGEIHPLGQVSQADEMPKQIGAFDREPVSGPSFVFDQACCAQLAKALGENASRHIRDSGRQLSVGQSACLQLPHNAQSPSPAEQIEQRQQGGIARLACSTTCHVRHLNSLADQGYGGKRADARASGPHGQSNALISDALLLHTECIGIRCKAKERTPG